ncbi:MAG: hypothetical protein LUH19_05630, partial [Lachnospiraceae bacterium]|nr:hypothetical protein [Lachnospiraceae bacterium]
METLKKIFNFQFGRRLIAILSIIALIILLIPVLRLMLYTAPWYDDYNYALTSRNYWLETHSLFYVLKGAFSTAQTMWYAWQGTFSSIFFMALMPALWGEEYYLLGPLFILIMLVSGSWVLTGVTLKRLFGAQRLDRLPLQAI